MEKTAYLSSAYLAPIEYYTKLYLYPQIYIEQYDHYIKQTYRNRCIIASSHGSLILTVPTEKTDQIKCLMKDVRISTHGNWQHLHWNAIEASYNNSPFFEYYKDDFFPFYEKEFTFLYDFNEQLRELVCNLIDLHPSISHTTDYRPSFTEMKQKYLNTEYDFREIIHPKKNYRQADPYFQPKLYYQVFESRHGFLPNLSIIDLLFNMGPESLIILKDSIVYEHKYK